MCPGCLANQSNVRRGPIIFDLCIFASSDSENPQKLFQVKTYDVWEVLKFWRKILFLQYKNCSGSKEFLYFLFQLVFYLDQIF